MTGQPPTDLYVTSLEEIVWGLALLTITMAMHASGMVVVLRSYRAFKTWCARRTVFTQGLFPLIVASWMILAVHLVEVLVWAAFFAWKQAFANYSTSYYFALNEYTTVGSSFNLPTRLRLLEGMIATAGLMTFAWSTGVVVTLGQEFIDRHIRRVQPAA